MRRTREWLDRIRRRPERRCRTLHWCEICEAHITDGQRYLDGGYGNRAHVACAVDAMRAAEVLP